MEKVKKCCKNCAYGIERRKAAANAPNIICSRRIDIAKGKIMITDEDYKCRKWQERGGTDDLM